MMDPLNIPSDQIPADSSYQWIDREFLDDALANGWQKVPFERHAGFLGAAFRTADGHTSLWNLTLCEKAKHEVKEAREQMVAKALENEVIALNKIKAAAAEHAGVAVDSVDSPARSQGSCVLKVKVRHA